MSAKFMKKLFGTSSLKKISVEDTNIVNAQLLELKCNKSITNDQYKKFRNFVADVRDDVLDIEREKAQEKKRIEKQKAERETELKLNPKKARKEFDKKG